MAHLTCPICGTSFDPAGQQTCAACPLQSGCQLVCCPNCGYQLVDPERSNLARLTRRLFFRKSQPQTGIEERRRSPARPGDHCREE